MRAAIAFLTVLPVGRSRVDVGWGTAAAFPLVGLIVGAAWWAAAGVGAWAWGPLVAAGLVLVVDLVLTGGLHLDGLADVADGVASRREGEKLRQVLADPRVGGIGAAALLTALLVRFAAIATVIGNGRAGLLVVAPVIGRVGMLLALAILPLTPGSLTSSLTARARGRSAAMSSVAALVGIVVVGALSVGVVQSLASIVLGAGTSVVLAAAWRRRHGFASGDVVGTAGILAELAVLLVLAA